MLRCNNLSIGLAAWLVGGMAGSSALAEPVQRIPLPPRSHTAETLGERIRVEYRMTVVTRPDGARWIVEVEADMRELQEKFPAMSARLPFPKDNCARKGENLVADHKSGDLLPEEGRAILRMRGRATLWGCTKIFGGNAKTHLVPPTDYDATAPVTAQIVQNGAAAQLVFGEPDIKLSGKAAPLARALLRLFKIDLNREAHKAIEKSIQPEKLTVHLPPMLHELAPRIESVVLGRRDGAALLLATISFAPPDDIPALLRVLRSLK